MSPPPAESAAMQVARAYRDVMMTAAWALIEADLRQRFGANPFRPGRPDETAFYCGCQAVLERFLEQTALALMDHEKVLPETSSHE